MIKAVFVVYKRPDLSTEEFRRYWKDIHAPIAANIPGLRKYTINPSQSDLDGSQPPYDGIAELYFDSAEASRTAWETPEGKAAFADAENFLTMERVRASLCEEISIV
jgi:uncharacterized protein (TIGR02118 family)